MNIIFVQILAHNIREPLFLHCQLLCDKVLMQLTFKDSPKFKRNRVMVFLLFVMNTFFESIGKR